METLYLVDGHAQFFRAYHAIRTPMSSPVTGEPTNATFGFVGMLFKLLSGSRPDYLAVAIDVSGDTETFRSTLYADYKAHRPPAPEDLAPQIRRCVSLLDAAGIPVLGVEGFEADDVIATVVRRLRRERPDLRVRIVSKDKDLQQLLETAPDGAGVELYDVHTDQVVDVAALEERLGIRPEQVIDLLALTGDTVDNVPGVEGVGPKTAAKLLAEYGSLGGVIEEAGREKSGISPKRRERILEAAELLPVSQRLVTLRDDCPVELDLAAAAVDASRLGALEGPLAELGFNRLREELARLRGAGDDAGAGGLFGNIDGAPPATPSRVVDGAGDLQELAAALRGAAVVALHGAMRDGALEAVHLAVESEAAWCVPAGLLAGDVAADLTAILADPGIAKIGHDLKPLVKSLRRRGIELGGIVDDTMLAAFLLDASRSSYAMEPVALAELGASAPRLGADPDLAPAAATTALRLHAALRPRLEEAGLDRLLHNVELPLLDVLADMELAGIRVDPDELDRQRETLETRIATLRGEIHAALAAALGDDAWPSFNPDSPKQLAAALFGAADGEPPGLGLKPVRRTKTGYSTDAETLEKLAADPAIETRIPRLVLEHRRLVKLVGTYLVALKEAIDPEDGRIHATFHQTGAATGRLSSSDPNLQNIPIRTDVGREIRRAFVAAPGCRLVSADYSQVELRVLAHLSGDPALIEAFQNDADIHRAVAAEIAGVSPEEVTSAQRSGAKMVNFGIVYGITPYGLARRLDVSTAEATEIIDAYKQRFAGITTFLEACVDKARRDGYVETILGHRRPVEGIDARQPQRRALAERIAINSVVQGSAADLIKVAMIALHAELPRTDPDARLLLQIHDELVFESRRENVDFLGPAVQRGMEQAMELEVPLRVEVTIGETWYEGKP